MVLRTLNLQGPLVDPNKLRGDPHWLRPVLEGLLRYTRPERVLDPTAGSGISARVCTEQSIPCTSSDLNDPAGRVDLFEIKETLPFDLVVFHPDLWSARQNSEHPNDLGGPHDWDEYTQLLIDAIEHLASFLAPNGSIFVVCPIARRVGMVYSLHDEIKNVLGGPRESEIILPHPECRSRGTLYGKRFVPIAHEVGLLYRKDDLEDNQSE